MRDASPRQQARLFKRIAFAAARAADDKKGGDIALLNIRPISTLADYLLIVSITSPNHMEAVEENIRKALKAVGVYPNHRDGHHSDLWRVLDYGGLIVHLMHPRARELYALERLFYGARKVYWNGTARRRTTKRRARGTHA